MLSPDTSPHQVVCAIDSNMAYALIVVVSSLKSAESSPFDLTVGYLDNTLPESDRQFITRACAHLGVTVIFMVLASDARFITQGHISPTTFAKFLLADALPEAHLWLDADTIASSGWDTIFEDIDRATLDEGLVAARRGTSSPKASQNASTELTFNAGVLGWPAGQRRNWREPLDSLEVVDTQEQFLFNLLYAKSARFVSERFNTLTYRLDTIPAEDPPFIIHYAGAHKPWHLRRPLAHHCTEYRCPWSAWFRAESHLLEGAGGTPLAQELATRQHQALRTGRVRWQRDHSGYLLLRLLTALGPLSPSIVFLLRAFSRWAPGGTHPLHERFRGK
jgi:lipopolysaccharide biosynthesis glycosyltransferase